MSKYSYTDEQFIKAVQDSLSIAEVCRRIGIVDRGGNYRVVHKKIDELGLDISHFTGKAWNQGKRYRQINVAKSLNEILTENSYYQSSKLLKRLIKEDVKERKCERCGRTEWEGELHPKNQEQVYCSQECAHKSKSKIPTKEELLKSIIELKANFTQLGKLYGVSDKSITKWCIKYNFPSKKQELLEYIKNIE